MKIVSIFAPTTQQILFSVCYENHKKAGKWVSEVAYLLRLFRDTEYLDEYINSNLHAFSDPFWRHKSIDDAFNQIIEEVDDIDFEFYKIQIGDLSARNTSEIFVPYHDTPNTWGVALDGDSWRKAKANRPDSLVRFYGISLDDGTIIITGGFIKLTGTIPEKIRKEIETQLKELRTFLDENSISNLDELIYNAL